MSGSWRGGEATAGLGPDRSGLTLEVEGGRVAALGRPTQGQEERLLPCGDSLLAPGRINAHTHVYSGLAPLGMPRPSPAPETFPQILERVWWRLDRALDADSLRAAARLYIAEALLAGTTTLVDHHESPELIEGSLDILADACQELGARAVLCYGASERNGGREEARRGLAECRRLILENRRPLVRGVVGLHASFTVSDETIDEAAGLCRELETVLHVHLAEDLVDVEDARRRGYAGPLERLLERGALPPGSILAHGVHLDEGQVARAGAAGLWLVQNPRSNRGNRVGYPPALGASGRVALGTDGYPSRMGEELEALLSEAQAYGESAAVSAPRAEAGWRLAEELFGMPFSPLAQGSAADVVAASEDGVRHVVVGGRPVVGDGLLLTADMESVRAEARSQAERLWRRLRAL